MLIVALILVLLNVIFVLSEFGNCRARKQKLEEFVKQGKEASLALKMSNSLDTLFSATPTWDYFFSSLVSRLDCEPAICKRLIYRIKCSTFWQ